jgi:hypothetical protein
MTRDMTLKQFAAALDEAEITPGLFGYYDIGGGLSIYARNGGPSRREQLAYLLNRQQTERGRDEIHRAHGGGPGSYVGCTPCMDRFYPNRRT